MNHGLRGLLDWLLPPRCAGCAAVLSDTGGLCGACEAGLGTPAPIPVGPPLASCTAAADFGGAVEDWIHRFKYPPPGLAGFDAAPLAAVRHLVLLAGARAPGPPPDLLVPIPLHPRRLRARADVAVPVEIDGDYVGTTPIEIELQPGAVPVLAPAGPS